MIKLLYAEGVETEIIIIWRMIISAPICMIIGYMVYQKRKGQVKFTPKLIMLTMFLGILNYYVAMYLDLLGIQYISAQLERIILFTFPTFVAILGFLIYRETISFKQFAAMILAYAGIAVMFGSELNVSGNDTLKGSLLVLGCALTLACYILFQKNPIKIMGSPMFTSIAMVAASFVILIHGAFSSGLEFTNISLYVFWLSFVTAIICTVIPSYLLAEAVGRIGSGPTSISNGIGPIFTSIFAVLTLGESFTIYHLIGTILVIVGIYLLSRVKKSFF